MSLTSHLRDAGSPVRAYLEGVSPILGDARGGEATARAASASLGLVELSNARSVAPPAAGVGAQLSGTAVDFRARIALGGFDPRDSAAALGVAGLSFYADGVENGAHRAKVLSEAFDVAVELLDGSPNETELDHAALLLAHCEQLHRGGEAVLSGAVGAACDRVPDGWAFAESLDSHSLTDLRRMVESNAGQLEAWREQIEAGGRYEPNPVFAGSRLVGGADGDWIIGDTLIDCKAYRTLSVPKLRDFVVQLLGYVMLDLDDALGIRRVGLWLPRQGRNVAWDLECLLGANPEERLPVLREGFRKATGGGQLAAHVPVTQRRKHQILADNKHTPSWMLADLSQSDDIDIRRRVGRNPVTPEATVRALTQDRYARVREGVASNECAPADILDTLSRDSSVAVRRAAAANPRTETTRKRALVREHVAEARTGHAVSMVVPAGTQVARSVPERDDAALDTRWFSEFLSLTGGLTRAPRSRLPLPQASEIWAGRLGQSAAVPDWLKAELPADVKADLMREGRPAWVRRAIARKTSVEDASARAKLLADPDPEIRWLTLGRTIDMRDTEMGELLTLLARSRSERLRFRTEGDDRPTWSRSRTPRQYDLEVLELVASHPSTPTAVLQELAETKTPGILVALVQNPCLPAETITTLVPRLRTIRSAELRAHLAGLDGIPRTVAEVLVEDRHADVRRALADNGRAPVTVLTQLAVDEDHSVRLGVFGNESTPGELAKSLGEALIRESSDVELLDVLQSAAAREGNGLSRELIEGAVDRLSQSRVQDPHVRRIAGADSRASAATLARLARSADVSVRGAVAGNASVSSDVLAALAEDPVPEVRRAAAGNPTLNLDVLAALARDDDPTVRASAARSGRLDADLLYELLLDEDRGVRSAAWRNPGSTPEMKARAEEEWDRVHPVASPSRAELEEWAASSRAEVRIQVALGQQTPADILALLAGERRSAKVRAAAAAHPDTPPQILVALASDSDDEVRQAVAFNGATPEDVLTSLARSRVDLALLAALNPGAPSAVLDVLADDGDPLVRYVASESRTARLALTRGGIAELELSGTVEGFEEQPRGS